MGKWPEEKVAKIRPHEIYEGLQTPKAIRANSGSSTTPAEAADFGEAAQKPLESAEDAALHLAVGLGVGVGVGVTVVVSASWASG